MKLKPIHYFFIIVLISLITSCGKSEDSKIVGTWSKIFVGPSTNNVIYTWTFTADHHLYVTKTDTSMADTSSLKIQKDTATWSITIHTLRKNTLKINQKDPSKSPIFPGVGGEFDIRKLNENILVIQRVKLEDGGTDGAYYWNEFVRKN